MGMAVQEYAMDYDALGNEIRVPIAQAPWGGLDGERVAGHVLLRV